MKTLFTILTFAFYFSIVNAQTAPSKQWDATFGGNLTDYINSIEETSDGGFILGGRSESGISGDKTQASQGLSDYWIVKTDAGGAKQWDARFGGSDNEFFGSVQQTSDGGYILGGYSYSGISGDKTQASQGNIDMWIVKTDGDGIKQWDARFGGTNAEFFSNVQQTSDGGYILGGYTHSGKNGDVSESNRGSYDYWIVKTDASGVKQWDKRFGGSGDDYLSYVQQTSEGGYLLGGQSGSGISGDKTQAGAGNGDYWVVKTDVNGVKQWDATFGGTGIDYLTALQQTSDGGCIAGGYSSSGIGGDKTQAGQGFRDYWVVKTDATGVKQWDVTFGGNNEDYLYSLQQTADNGYIFAGYSSSGISGDKTQAPQGGADFWIIKTDNIGTKVWETQFGGSSGDYLYSLQQTTDYGYILAGASSSPISFDKSQASQGLSDMWILKTTIECPFQTYYSDVDGDGYGDPTVHNCGALAGYVLDHTDCNDANPAVHPGTIDVCNSIDDNCDNVIDENAIPATITPSGTVDICDGSTIVLTANSGSGISYQWIKGSKNLSGETNQTYSAKKAANYMVTETNSFGCTSTSAKTTVTVLAVPTATITPLGTLDLCATGTVSLQANSGAGYLYQWTKGVNPISGETNQNYTTTKKGTYKVIVTNANNCSKTSAGTTVTKSCKESAASNPSEEIQLYPNPGNCNFTIEFVTAAEHSLTIKIFDVVGKEVFSSEEGNVSGTFTKALDLSNLPSGTYLLKVIDGGVNEMKKLVIEK